MDGPCKPRRTRSAYLPAVALIVLLASGCSSPLLQQPSDQPVRTYLLEWRTGTTTPAKDPMGPDLLIAPVLAAPGFDGSDMAYMRQPHQIEYFARHRWVDAPARMLEPLLLRAATDSGLFRSVVEAGTGARSGLRLDARLLQLLQVCRLNPSELRLALRVSLVDVASGRVLGSRVLSVTEPIDERSPYAGVQAANRAVARLLSGLQAFLAEQLGNGAR